MYPPRVLLFIQVWGRQYRHFAATPIPTPIPENRLPIRMPAFDFKKYWIYVSTNQSFDRIGKQITLCESLSSFSQFLPEPDTGLLNPTSLRKPLNSACPTQHKPLKTPIRCLRTPQIGRAHV